MASYRGPKCRLCRREGAKLFLKGFKCLGAKCMLERRKSAPGATASRRPKKLSEYGVQMREKQKLKRIYGLYEKQFRLNFERAASQTGITGEILMEALECRLDNVIYRLKFAGTRKACRQMIAHGHIKVNTRKVTVASFMVKPGDVITVRDTERSKQLVSKYLETTDLSDIPTWLRLDAKAVKGEVVERPLRKDIPVEVSERLIVELYSK